nr:MAG TPA: hypothetical protein [Caudoviricetes sp.]
MSPGRCQPSQSAGIVRLFCRKSKTEAGAAEETGMIKIFSYSIVLICK